MCLCNIYIEYSLEQTSFNPQQFFNQGPSNAEIASL